MIILILLLCSIAMFKVIVLVGVCKFPLRHY